MCSCRLLLLHCFVLLRPSSSLPLAVGDSWQRFLTAHTGEWRGTWSTHSADGSLLDTVAAGSRLLLEDDAAVQTLLFATSSVRSDCEKCFDSEEVREIPAGRFTADSLRHVCCGPASVLGPRVLRSGAMNLELTMRNADSRVRVVAAWQPASTMTAADGPSSLVLGKVTVAREALALGRAHSGADGLSVTLQREDAMGGTAAGGGGEPWVGHYSHLSTPTPLAEPEVTPARLEELPEISREGALCMRDLADGVTVSLPSRVKAAEPASVTVRWRPNGTGLVKQIDATIEALGRRVVSSEASVVMAPPQLLSLTLTELASA